MMEVVSSAANTVAVIQAIWSILFRRPVHYTRLYGPISGPLLWLFGSDAVWRMQLQVLQAEDSNVAMAFKQTSKDESSMVAVAVSIPLYSRERRRVSGC